MSTQKNNLAETFPNNEVSEVTENFDTNVINKYQELNNKCDVVIKKIKSRKSNKNNWGYLNGWETY